MNTQVCYLWGFVYDVLWYPRRINYGWMEQFHSLFSIYLSCVYLFLMFSNNLTDNDSYNIAFNLLTFHHHKWALPKASTYTHTHIYRKKYEGHVCNGEYFVGFSWEISKILVSFFVDSYIIGVHKCIPLDSYFLQYCSFIVL